MRALEKKLIRDLKSLWGQVAAITLVLGAGIMTLVVSVATLDALKITQANFYETQNFGEVFADLKRAPNHLTEQISHLSGVDQIETRIQAPMRLSIEGFDDPIQGVAVSIPEGRQPTISRLYLREGRLPVAERDDEVVISDGFAEAHGLRAGAELQATIAGRSERLTVTGIALSPEFIYQRSPADLFPDHLRYALIWMNQRALASAYGMEGAFNQLAVTLQPGVSPEPVIDAIDQILKPHGSLGAYARADHMSHRFLAEEIKQLSVMAWALPVIFLGVAAFLLNILMGRLLAQQRQDIAMLKAFGYGRWAIGWHYISLTLVIVFIGALAGNALGVWASSAMADLYLDFFRFPSMQVGISVELIIQGLIIAGGAALLGTWRGVARTMWLPPAQAMQPPTPTRFRSGALEDLGWFKKLSQPSRILIRHLNRHRFKASFSVLGIALSGALLLVGSYQFGATDELLDVQFQLIEKADLRVVFTESRPQSSLVELKQLPGVLHAEGFRSVPIRLIHGHQRYRTSLLGTDAKPMLHSLLDDQQTTQTLPEEGLVISDYLASLLGLQVGDMVRIEVLEGAQQALEIPLVATVADWVGVSGNMERQALNRWLGEGPTLNGAWLMIDESRREALFDALWERPAIAGIGVVHLAETQIRDFIRESILVMMAVLLLLAGGIAFGVIYNNARLAFAERARELATLRVLGFSKREVASILMGEMTFLTLVSIPVGWCVGWVMAKSLSQVYSMELMRIPFIVGKEAYALSASGVLIASLISMALIAPRLYRLDMVMALKTVE